MQVKMLSRAVPIAGMGMPDVGAVIDVSDDVAASLIRGGDAEEYTATVDEPTKLKRRGRPPKRKDLGAAPENK